MKYFLVCASLVLGSLSVQARPGTKHLNHQQKELLSTYKKDCIAQSGVDAQVVDKTKEGVFANDPLLKEFQFCFAQKLGFQNSDGQINQDVFKEKLRKLTDDDDLFEKLSKCGVESSSPQETAYQVGQCLYNNSPSHIQFYLFSPGVVHLSPEKSRRFRKIHKKCVKDTQVSEELVKNAHRKGEYVEDPKFKEFVLCLSKNIGYQNEHGELQKDAFRNSSKEILNDDAAIDKLCEKCLVQQGSPQDTAFFVFKCLSENSPVRVHFFQAIPEEIKQKINANIQSCLEKNPVPKEILEKSRSGDFVDDKQLKDYLLCINKKSEVQNEDGKINVDLFKKRLSNTFSESEVNEVTEKCAKNQMESENTAFEMFKCFYAYAPEFAEVF